MSKFHFILTAERKLCIFYAFVCCFNFWFYLEHNVKLHRKDISKYFVGYRLY